MQAVYVLVAIICNVAGQCIEYGFEGAEYPSYRDCMDAARDAERDNRFKTGMKNVEFDCQRELKRK